MSATGSAPSRARILVVEDEAPIRALLEDVLGEEGHQVTCVGDGRVALRVADGAPFDLILTDLMLPGIDGMSLLGALPSVQPDAQIVMMTAHGTVETAVEAMKLGAFDYLRKPFHLDELTLVVARALRESALRREVAALRREAQGHAQRRIVGHHQSMQRLFDAIARVAPLRTTVLVTGETGTGKELVARAVHDLSDRAGKPFIPVHCASLPETLLESELFGHVKGAFTGAVAHRRGVFEEASGGTLFLDEIATISPAVQVKLLRVLQERMIQRLGSPQPVPVDFRLVAAANVDLRAEVAAGRFREDLFYRLNVYPVAVPPLRERREDIPLLVHHFLVRFAEEHGAPASRVTPETMARLAAHDWPGNVRELEHFVERATILAAGGTLRFDESLERPASPVAAASSGHGARDLVGRGVEEGWDIERLEREYVLAMLERTGGRQGRAADVLGIDRRTLYRKLKKWAAEGHAVPAAMPD